ncbi:MAG: MMPL family transporter [Syntrophobacteraceae bacterium]
MSFLSRLVQVWINLVLRFPRLVLVIAFLTALASIAVTASKLEMITDQLELISEDHPFIALSDRLDSFNANNKRSLHVVIEAATPQRAISFVNELGSRIEQDPNHFQSIYYRVDPEPFKEWQLLYLDKPDIVALQERIESHSGLIEKLAEEPELLSFLKILNQQMASRMVDELFTGFLVEGETKETKDKEEPFDLGFVIDTLEGMSSYLKGATDFNSPWTTLLTGLSWDADQEGYFWESHKRYLIAFVTPNKSDDGVLVTLDALEQLRKHIQELKTTYPDVDAGVTGQEALNNDEMNTVMGDMEIATWLSILGVLLLLIAFRRSFRRPLLQGVSLSVGLCWSFGSATLLVGHLNMLSVVFAPLLCGLGIDSAIHWFSRLEEEERSGTNGMDTVIRRVCERSGPGIILATLGTTLAFLPFILTGFKGLMELGLITGMGIFLNLLSDFTVLPALTLLFGTQTSRPVADKSPGAPRDFIRFNAGSARAVLWGSGVVALLCMLSASQVYFDLNPLRLQTADAESVVWEKTLIENSERSALFASSLAASAEEVRAKTQAFKALASVSAVESALSLLPEDQEEKISLLRTLEPSIPAIESVPPETRPSDRSEFISVLERIRFKLQDEEAGRWGAEKPLVEQMARVRALASEIVTALESSPDAMDKLLAYRVRFYDDLGDKWDTLRKGVNASPMSVADLPDMLKGWFYQDGTFLLRVFPRESVWEEHALTRFVREIQSIDPQVVGDPVSLHVFASAFKTACIKASIYAVIAIFVLLTLTFRDLRLTVLAFVPLALGTLLTVGIMGLANIPFNLANSIFMPLVVGAGVEYAVVILSRWREGRMLPGHLPLSTAKGVILAALTTTVGFGALMISHHRGIFSLGFVSWAGSLCVLLSALLVLPAVLACFESQEITSARPLEALGCRPRPR